MPTIVVRLEDILTDEANPVDLASLPSDEARAHQADLQLIRLGAEDDHQ
jgi:hypothetical protein